MAFQKGNTLGGRPKQARLFDEALRRAIAQSKIDKIRDAAEKLLDLAAAGEMWAIRELADRLDGRATQSVEVTDNREPRDLTIDEILALIAAERAAEKETSDTDISSVH